MEHKDNVALHIEGTLLFGYVWMNMQLISVRTLSSNGNFLQIANGGI